MIFINSNVNISLAILKTEGKIPSGPAALCIKKTYLPN